MKQCQLVLTKEAPIRDHAFFAYPLPRENKWVKLKTGKGERQ